MPPNNQLNQQQIPQPTANRTGSSINYQGPQRQQAQIQPSETKANSKSTQDSLLIAEVRDGVVIMRDGSLRTVIMTHSINFDLMSPQERDAVEYSYQGFINSLRFPVQIVVRSQKIDLDNYVLKLEDTRRKQENMLLGLLMEDYIAYVRYLVEAANIMDKQFYIVVPYYPPLTTQEGLSTGARKFASIFQPTPTVTMKETDFQKYKGELAQQAQVVLNGLGQMGIRAIPLNTQELIELYYDFYNPETAKQQHLTDINQLDAPVVEKGEGRAKTIYAG